MSGHTEVLECVRFSVPSFHAYGHKPACYNIDLLSICLTIYNIVVFLCIYFMQIVFSPLCCDGLGLSDGEVMERMWSYLRCFSRMTKEMCPAHRVDVLSHALLYYGFKQSKNLVRKSSFMSVIKFVVYVPVVYT